MSERRRLNRSQRVKAALPFPTRLSHVSATGPVKAPVLAGAVAVTTPARQSGIWYAASLDGEQVACGKLAALCEQFAVTVRDAGEPAGACLFSVSGDGARDGESGPEPKAAIAIFFSPSAISVVPKILAALNAQPSAAPERAGASLLVGRPLDWNQLPHASH